MNLGGGIRGHGRVALSSPMCWISMRQVLGFWTDFNNHSLCNSFAEGSNEISSLKTLLVVLTSTIASQNS